MHLPCQGRRRMAKCTEDGIMEQAECRQRWLTGERAIQASKWAWEPLNESRHLKARRGPLPGCLLTLSKVAVDLLRRSAVTARSSPAAHKECQLGAGVARSAGGGLQTRKTAGNSKVTVLAC
ncbi:uncharacterized protein TRAVEDRAFT_54232 [Trametes versicolor FP-101664 SS1]|uniref:Uncharacterized protein n=1 Tax=Trametes versicolor (strain FP-101664) TaxID=717944 RepID=R7S813_TRAVS|nr:uncharacterized protein TRAVEDRAFT_54232 [Trametes versicolor FP-101664 SS1]EIW51807.1 hypothetical protein TRAVEDRAFT_54232 [Trametes versicolor FP-101664 SS1]